MHQLWLLFVLLFCCGCATACPEGCSCFYEQGLYTANCSFLPYNAGKVQMLTLLPTRDSPLELSDGQFNSARHLNYLYLKNCSIYFLHKKAFYGAKNVLEIDLSFNYIEELEPTVFQHLMSLTTLILRGNPIHFQSELPFIISNSLQHLDIGQCKLRSVPRGIFYGLKRLKYLFMDGNFLKSLKYNSLPKGLKYLNLSQNLIVNVPTEVISALTNLRRIGLSGNPINCSCPLMNLQDWLSGRGVVFEDDVTCSLPIEYYGISWSKVDENRLCMAEARTEEISHSTAYNQLIKNRLYRGNYFDNENSYLGENIQSDQPQSSSPDSEAEILFQNDETFAMGEMMRDEEEDATGLDEKEHIDHINDASLEINKETVTVSNIATPAQEIEADAVETQDFNTHVENIKPEDKGTENKNEESTFSKDSDAGKLLQNANLETTDLNLQDTGNSHEVTIKENPVENNVEYLNPLEENGKNNGSVLELDAPQSVNLSESKPVEFKPLTEEEPNVELDDLIKEGLFHFESDKYSLDTNSTLEESTVVPDIEDTTEIEISTTQTALSIDINEDGDLDDVAVENSTLNTEINNNSTFENISESIEDEVIETVPPPVMIPDLLSNNESAQNVSILVTQDNENKPSMELGTNTENKSLQVPDTDSDNEKEKIKEVAGAEVVMFCVGVLVICLVLYSIYRCKTSRKRQSMRIVKDMELSRGTEMQDMASLLPKPQDDDKKNNMKYPDKAPSSETMKLITEKNDNETHKFTPVADTKHKIENKNSLNNNTSSSPTSKIPLIKPGNPVTINPAAPIQRTKVKVGIIPDSIPRTPIFLQKTYNNGMKKV